MNHLKWLVLSFLLITSRLQALEDFVQKEQHLKKIVSKAVNFARGRSVEKFISEFSLNPEWAFGAVTLFVYDSAGAVYFDQLDMAKTWQTIENKKTLDNIPIMEVITKKPLGSLIDYFVNNSIRHAYVQAITESNRTYYIGAGFFVNSAPELCIILMKKTKEMLMRLGTAPTFDLINKQPSTLRVGNIAPIIFQADGTCAAHGINPSEVNKKVDRNGTIRKALDAEKGQALWLSKEGPPRHKILVDIYRDSIAKKDYYIVLGFYDMTLRDVVSIGANFDFSKLQNKSLAITGDLIVHSIDESTKTHKKLFDDTMRDGSAWFNRMKNQSIESIYALKIPQKSPDIKTPKVMVIEGYYPTEIREITAILLDDAADLIDDVGIFKALIMFSQPSSRFIRGSVMVSVYDPEGFSLIQGYNRSKIWEQDKLIINRPDGWIVDERTHHVRNLLITNLDNNYSLVSGYYAL